MGNHECFPIDLFDFGDKGAMDWMYGNYSEFISSWVDDQAVESMKKRLSYSYTLPKRNLKLISFMGESYDGVNFWLAENPTD